MLLNACKGLAAMLPTSGFTSNAGGYWELSIFRTKTLHDTRNRRPFRLKLEHLKKMECWFCSAGHLKHKVFIKRWKVSVLSRWAYGTSTLWKETVLNVRFGKPYFPCCFCSATGPLSVGRRNLYLHYFFYTKTAALRASGSWQTVKEHSA